MTVSTTLSPPVVAAPEDEVFTIHNLLWDQYVAINDALGDQAGLRVLYLDGRLTFVSPGYVHEWSEDAIDTILLAIAADCEIEMSVLGSTTLRGVEGGVGLEGDRMYYVRDNVEVVGRPETIDLAIHPPPDLAIEVENTHRASDAMPIYARLGVPEVWRHDVRRITLGFWALQPDGSYQDVPQSQAFPFLTPDDILFQIQQAREIHSRTRWFRQLTNWVRDVIVPRLGPADGPDLGR